MKQVGNQSLSEDFVKHLVSDIDQVRLHTEADSFDITRDLLHAVHDKRFHSEHG
jgi:hypothetical protein